jgi:hypothetical protein
MTAARTANNAIGVLAQPMLTGSTIVTVEAGQGAKFPTVPISTGPYFWATLVNAAGQTEIIKVQTHASGSDVFTGITRAQQGTTAITCAIGDRIEMRITAEHFDEKFSVDGGVLSGRLEVQQPGAASYVPTLLLSKAGSSPFIEFEDDNFAEIGRIEATPAALGDSRLTIKAASNVIDMTGQKIRNSGVETYLGEVISTTDVPTFSVIFADLGIDTTLYKEIIIRMYNMGVTTAVSTHARFYFGTAGTTGTVYTGANHRWAMLRALYDGTTSTTTNEVGWSTNYIRVGTAHDSTAHWSFLELKIPNPAHNAYSSYSESAYPMWLNESRGLDISSRPQTKIGGGFINDATKIGTAQTITGVYYFLSAAGNFRNIDIKIFGRLI